MIIMAEQVLIQFRADKVLKQDPMPGTKINSKYNTVALLVCREDKSVVVDKDKDDNEEKDSEDEEDE